MVRVSLNWKYEQKKNYQDLEILFIQVLNWNLKSFTFVTNEIIIDGYDYEDDKWIPICHVNKQLPNNDFSFRIRIKFTKKIEDKFSDEKSYLYTKH